MSKSKKSRDVEAEVTHKIIKALENGTAPWVKPWTGDSAFRNPVSGTTYRGINIVLLTIAQMLRDFSSTRWVTFNQVRDLAMSAMAQDLGKATMAEAPKAEGKRGKVVRMAWMRDRLIERGLNPDAYPHVRKDATGELVIFQTFKEYERVDENAQPILDDQGKPMKKSVFIRRGYTVFNLDQVANVPERYQDVEVEATFQLDEELEQALADTLPEVTWRIGGGRACYSPSLDAINMPDIERFNDLAAWYSTKLHECVHATGHESRLNRLERFPDKEAYAREELVAEMGSAFLCAHLGIDGFLQHPEYIGNWIKALKQDKREIFRAASKAQKAADFLLDGMGLSAADSDHESVSA